MPRLSLWNSGKKGADYKFIDRQISGYFFASGTALYVHKYLGPHDQTDPETVKPGDPVKAITERSIQDPVFLENRDRKYDTTVYEMRGTYNVQDNDFDLKQFGLFLTGDTLFIEVHLNDMIAQIGRKLMAGDVIELPHQRDDALLDPDAPAINKFYSIADASRASGGYSATWYPHIWRLKCEPMTATQAYADILEGAGTNPFGVDDGTILGNTLSMVAKELEINEEVVELAKQNVKARNFETRHFYVIEGEGGLKGGQNPWVYAGDGAPPNGAKPIGSGSKFPMDAADGDYYLRTDYAPETLFRLDGRNWYIQELDYRQGHWSVAHRLLEDFINNDKVSVFKDGRKKAEKTPLFKAVKPEADF
ncbi:MAG: hypothetical protein EOP83_27185 [Verrucomicrobiaceae bacterium]|nr:MAG: hypothetical protein EOP83_27185 [Verrucomicrobiaceae bacterium]